MIIYLCSHCAKELGYTERPALWRCLICDHCKGAHQPYRENAGEYRTDRPKLEPASEGNK